MIRISCPLSIIRKRNQLNSVIYYGVKNLCFPFEQNDVIFVMNIYWDKMCCWTVRNHDAVDVGRVYEYRWIGKSIATGKDIYQFREAAASESQRGSGEKCFGVAAVGLDMFPTASEPHKLNNFAMWGWISFCLSASQPAGSYHLHRCLQSFKIQSKFISYFLCNFWQFPLFSEQICYIW